MQSKGMLDFFKNRNKPVSVSDFLEYSSFDELIEIDLNENRYRFVYNVADKYYAPVTAGVYSEFYRYAADHMIHPDDAGFYADVMNPDTILQRRCRTVCGRNESGYAVAAAGERRTAGYV